jgi:long-chain acyl-CoA synthetase
MRWGGNTTVREFSSPASVDLTPYRNVTDLLVQRVQAAPDHIAFDVAGPGSSWRQVTTAEFAEQVQGLARGLIAAGLQAGEAVGLMAATRYEWAVCDLAVWYAGGVAVPIYETSAPGQVAAIIAAGKLRLGLGGTQAHSDLLVSAFEAAGRRCLGVWTMDARPGVDLQALTALGAQVGVEELEARRLTADLDAPATVVFTSGTSGRPKGAIITHRNFVGQVLAVSAGYQDVVRPDGNTVIFLPLAHVLARGLQLICLAKGMRIAHIADPKQVVAALPRLRPTFLVVVPRVLQKIEAAAADKAARVGLGWLWASAKRTAIRAGTLAERRDAGEAVSTSAGQRLRQAVFERLFYAKLRAKLGGRIDYLLSGAASLDAELSVFFRGVGLPVVEGYGLTETTAPITGNLPGSIRSGTVGVPLPGSTVRISEDGEVLTRGIGVFAGYLDPSDNAEAFVEGFFRTGDLGSLDEDGRLQLLGRVKDVIVTANGKTVSPLAWEHAVEAEPLVAHAVLVGEGRPYLGGLILLDVDSLRAWANRHGSKALAALATPAPGQAIRVEDSRLAAIIARSVRAANAQVSRSEQARRFDLLVADLSVGGGVVTPTQKLKRANFTQGVGDIIDGLYLGTGTAA